VVALDVEEIYEEIEMEEEAEEVKGQARDAFRRGQEMASLAPVNPWDRDNKIQERDSHNAAVIEVSCVRGGWVGGGRRANVMPGDSLSLSLKRKSRSRETALSQTDVMTLPSSALRTLLRTLPQLLGLRHRRSQRSARLAVTLASDLFFLVCWSCGAGLWCR